jgi:hypothetical protein
MPTDYRKYRKDLASLMAKSKKLLHDLEDIIDFKQVQPGGLCPGLLFFTTYQDWYTEAQAFISQVMPARLPEFEALYEGEPGRKTVDVETYAVRDIFLDFDDPVNTASLRKMRVYSPVVLKRFHLQYQILEAAVLHFLDLLTRFEAGKSKSHSNDDAAIQASRDINRIIVENKDKLFADGDASFWEESFTL